MLTGRSFVSVNDFTNREIETIFKLADEMDLSLKAPLKAQYGLLKGKIMASLFFEPSTRTRLSFESAMHRLGGDVITVVEGKSTSMAKGETLADTAKIIGQYADIIVIRHPWEGAAKVFADYAGIPVINAGDGGHEHPTQTLCDLYTLKKEKKSIRGLKIALWGDLKNGRTVHSLIFALARFGATIHFRPKPGLEVPDYIIRKLKTEYGGTFTKNGDINKSIKGNTLPIDAIYVTPVSPNQPSLFPNVNVNIRVTPKIDALYVMRLQVERMTDQTENEESREQYPVVNKELLRGKEFEKALVMHPLPRVDELSYDLDSDPRSMYFEQAARGVPIRMALLAAIFGAKDTLSNDEYEFISKKIYPLYKNKKKIGIRCSNPKCISVQESEKKYIIPEFQIISEQPLTLRCIYCEHETTPSYVASSEWHEGTSEYKIFHTAESHWATEIKPENLILFGSKEDAESLGFKLGKDNHPSRKKNKSSEKVNNLA